MKKSNRSDAAPTKSRHPARLRRAAGEAFMTLEPRQLMTVLLGYDVHSQSGGSGNFGTSPLAASVADLSLSNTVGLTRGSGVSTSGTGAARGLGGTGFDIGGTESTEIGASKDFTFGFTVAAGKTVSLSEVDDSYRRSGTGPASTAVQYSLDGTNFTDVTQFANSSTASTGATNTMSLTGVSALQNIPAGTTVTFRLVPYGATGTGGTYYVFDTANTTDPDLELQGTTGVVSSGSQSVYLDTNTYNVSEGAGSVTLTVDRAATTSGDIGGTLTVPYALANGTAVAGTNYTAGTTPVTFQPNQTSATITVGIIAANPQGGDKTFTVTLGSPTLTGDGSVTAAVTSPAAATVTVVDSGETFSLSSATYNVNDTAGTAIVSVVRSGNFADAASVIYSTTGSVSASGTVNFAAGQQIAAVSIPVSDVTGNQTFGVALSSPAGQPGDLVALGSNTPATVTIVDAAAAFSTLTGAASSVTDIETSGPYTGTTFAPIVGDKTAGTGSFSFLAYELVDFNKATTPSVYPAGSSTLTALSNLTVSLDNTAGTGAGNYAGHAGNINVYLIPDTTTATTSLKFDVTQPTGLAATQFASAPILLGTFGFVGTTAGYENYTPASLSASASSVLISSLNSGSAFRLAVTPELQGVGAVAADYDFKATGPNSSPIVTITGTLSAQPESFYVDSTSTTVDKTAGTVTINIDRKTPAPGDLSDAATVVVTTTDGTAVSGTDYSGGTQTATFLANSSTTSITIPILNNVGVYGDKTFSVTLSGPTTGTGRVGQITSPATDVVTIRDSRTTDVTAQLNTLAVVQPNGPSTATTYFTAEANNTANGTFASFAVADLFPASLPSGETVGTIDSVYLNLVNTTASFAKAGPLDVYLVSDTSTALDTPTLTFNASSSSTEGLGNQLGTATLLGTINYDPSLSTTSYNQFLLNNAAGLTALAAALNGGGHVRIAVTPEDGNVSARFVGEDSAAVEYPYLSINYTKAVVGGLPSYLDPSSQATYDSGSNTLTVTGPTTFIGDPGSASFGSVQPNVTASGSTAKITFATTSGSQVRLAGLSLSNGASAVESNPSTAPVVVEIAGAFTVDSTSTFDVGFGDLVVHAGSLASINTLVARGYNLNGGANWKGTGITSSAASADTKHLHAVGAISDPTTGTFDGDTSATAGDVLVKYTYFGDANLSGKVDGSDYSLIDAGYASPTTKTGWSNGDFNYNGTVDGSDYTLIDNAFNSQAGPIVFSPSALVAVANTSVAEAGSTDASPAVPANLVTHTGHPIARFVPNMSQPFFSNTPILTVGVPDALKQKARPTLAGSLVDSIGKATK